MEPEPFDLPPGRGFCLAYYDPGRIVDEHNKLIPLKDLPEDVRRAIGGVKVLREKTTRLGDDTKRVVVEEALVETRAWDKNAALDKAMRYLKLLTDKSEVKLGGSMTIRSEQEAGWTKYLSDEELDTCNAAIAETKPIIAAAEARWAAARAARQRGNS